MMRRIRAENQVAAIAVAGFALAWGCGTPTTARAQGTVTQEVVVSFGTELATNPYLEGSDQGASIGATAEIRPRLSYDTSVTRFDLSAFAQGTRFVEDYGFQDNYGASASVRQRVTEQLGVSVNAGISSLDSRDDSIWLRSGQDDFPGAPLLPDVPIDDVTVLGQRGRTTAISAGVGIEYAANARDQFQLLGDYQNMSMTHFGAEDYQVAGAEGRYNRVISERTTAGVILGYRFFNYDDAASADAESISARGSFSYRLDQAWMLSTSLGIERTTLKASPTGAGETHDSLSGTASLCRSDTRERLCIDLSRQSRPTGYAGIRRSDTIGVSYSLQVSEYDSVTLGGAYSRDGSFGSVAGPVPTTELMGVRGGFEHRFNRRLSGYVDASYDRTDRGDVSLDPRVRVGAGIRYVFGRTG